VDVNFISSCSASGCIDDVIIVIINKEAQLSQRDRATLRVIEYFAKSLR